MRHLNELIFPTFFAVAVRLSKKAELLHLLTSLLWPTTETCQICLSAQDVHSGLAATSLLSFLPFWLCVGLF